MSGSSERQEQLVHRLKSARGHLEAVIEMVERQAPCEEVVRQIFAVRCALDASARSLIEGDVRRCVQILRLGGSRQEIEPAAMRILALAKAHLAEAGNPVFDGLHLEAEPRLKSEYIEANHEKQSK